MIPFADILIALKWLAVLEVCSMLGVLVFMRPGGNAPMRYVLGKASGVIGLGAITWVLSLAKIIPFTYTWAWVITIVLYAVVIAAKQKTIWPIVKQNWRAYAVLESVFLGLFAIGITFRSLIPKIEGIEKPMDAAILSNLLRHTTGVPVDTWYAPDHINYYYFGHWIIAMLAKLSQTTLAYAFNLGFATVLAISGSAVFGLGWQLAKRKIAGLLALFLTFFASNLHPFFMILAGHQNYFFFNSGRFINEVINEYPLYSLILGDLHAHMMALMLSIGFYLTVALIYIEKNAKNSRLILAAIAGCLVGLLSATNSFDVISCGLIFILLLALMRYKKQIDNLMLIKLVVAFGLAFTVLTLVFLTHFRPAVGGVGVALFKTPFKHVFWQFGLPVILGVAAWIILYLKTNVLKKSKPLQVASLLGLVGLIMVLLPQIIYLKDIYFYQNPPFARANTVFKMWYAAWPLIAISTAVLLTALYQNLKKPYQKTIVVLVMLASCIALSFGLNVGLNTLQDTTPNTLNGLNFIGSADPAKLAVINWVNSNISGQPIVLQAVGDSYGERSWLASYSGLPTIMGWQSHEWGWRYDANEWGRISQKSQQVKNLYESATTAGLQKAATALNVKYVLLGPDELGLYKIDRQVFNGAFGQPVFSNARYAIYAANR